MPVTCLPDKKPCHAPNLPFGKLQDVWWLRGDEARLGRAFKLFARSWRSAERLLPLCCLPPAGHATGTGAPSQSLNRWAGDWNYRAARGRLAGDKVELD
jgi:hypothetical protein